MIISIEEFLQMFPEFNNLDLYPQSRIRFWLEFSTQLVNEARWGSLTKYGICFLAAHQLFISNLEGQVLGPSTSQSGEGLSESYGSLINDDWSHYNLSTYGVQYMQLVKVIGAGPIMAI